MKKLTRELIQKIRLSHSGLQKVSWNEIYDTEAELLADLFNDKVIVDGYSYKLCRGYEYIKGFRNYYGKHGELTDKQMTQLKRLASNIAYCIYADS